MKNIFFKGLAFLLVVGLSIGCNKEPIDNVTQEAKEGGLIEVQTQLHVYKKGDAAKDFNTGVLVFQSDINTTKVHIYKQFFTASGKSSNIELLKSVDIDNKSNASIIEFSAKYEQLAEGLKVDGADMNTANDDNLVVGDFWVLSYKTETSQGNTFLNKATTKVGVSGRLAGVYNVARGWYIHPSTAPGLAGNYAGNVKVIESVSDGLYRITAIGPWSTSGALFFTADETNFTITVPKEVDGKKQKVWGDKDEVATCQDNATELAHVTCTNTFTYEDDQKDVIKISYGYIRTSGTREFDEILIKQ